MVLFSNFWGTNCSLKKPTDFLEQGDREHERQVQKNQISSFVQGLPGSFFAVLRCDLLLSPVKLYPPLGVIPTENGPAVVGQVKPHFGEQLLRGDVLPFEEPQYPPLRHQKIAQVNLDALLYHPTSPL